MRYMTPEERDTPKRLGLTTLPHRMTMRQQPESGYKRTGSVKAVNLRFQYREEYLQVHAAGLRQDFEAIGVELQGVRCSCSFAYRGGRSVIGQCFPGSMAADGVPQIKISPVIDDPVEVLAVLVHELIHACRPDARHGAVFREIALGVGLTGPMRSTTAGPALIRRLGAIASALGPYPHAAIDLDKGSRTVDEPRVADEPPPQIGRLIKVACPECGYPARVTRVWLARLGPPICPCGPAMLIDGSHPLMGGGQAS